MDTPMPAAGEAPARFTSPPQFDPTLTPPEVRSNRVYDAEERAHAAYVAGTGRAWPVDTPLDGTIEGVQAWVDKIMRSKWWRTHYIGRKTHIECIAIHGNGAYATGATIRISRRHMANPWTVLHELAHHMGDAISIKHGARGGHGRDFAYAYLRLVTRWMGPEAAGYLRREFIAGRVKHQARKVSR